jgi:hypothetical protein
MFVETAIKKKIKVITSINRLISKRVLEATRLPDRYNTKVTVYGE